MNQCFIQVQNEDFLGQKICKRRASVSRMAKDDGDDERTQSMEGYRLQWTRVIFNRLKLNELVRERRECDVGEVWTQWVILLCLSIPE